MVRNGNLTSIQTIFVNKKTVPSRGTVLIIYTIAAFEPAICPVTNAEVIL